MIWKWLLGILGFFSLGYILHNYGFAKILSDTISLGWWSIPLALSFLPVTTFFSLAWWLVTPEAKLKDIPHFIYCTIISIAWNNLSPFVKVLGEPIKVALLSKRYSQKASLKSVVIYNLVHVFGTVTAFIVGASIILWLYPVPSGFRIGFISLIVICCAFLVFLYKLPKLPRKSKRKAQSPWLKKSAYWLKWTLSKIRIFNKKNAGRFWLAVASSFIARFVEGLTFYIAFIALNHPIPMMQAALLDVGRAILDNLFFFIPYQVGSREASILLLTKEVMGIGGTAAVSAALFYRLVEIIWIGIGYALWINAGISDKSRRKKSASHSRLRSR